MSSAARRGLTAKTLEWILTPAGIPMAGTPVPIAPNTSRAVPSPPANTISSAPQARRSAAARVVSAPVVAPDSIDPSTIGS